MPEWGAILREFGRGGAKIIDDVGSQSRNIDLENTKMQFGKTWWGQQWINALSNIDFSNRLPRGSAYARKGAVLKLEVDNNEITAVLLSLSSSSILETLFFGKGKALFDKPGQSAISEAIQQWLERYYLSLGEYKPIIEVSEIDADCFGVQISIRLDRKIVPIREILNNKEYDSSLSGKTELLLSRLEGILENNEKVLIFT